MDERVVELLEICMKNKIDFEYHQNVEQISIKKLKRGEWVIYAYGYLDESLETKEVVLDRLHNVVDQYLGGNNK